MSEANVETNPGQPAEQTAPVESVEQAARMAAFKAAASAALEDT